jgi:predicted transposase/invertase (TIGR01784 family)
VFPDRAADSGRLTPYEPLLQYGLVHRVYLAELPGDPGASFGTRLARLAVLDATQTVEEARALLAQQPTEHQRDLAIDLIETILVHKFPQLSRDEIRTMLQLPETDLKKTRFYQEVFQEGLTEGREEGREEGRLEGEQFLVMRQLKRRLGTLTAAQQTRIQALSPDALCTLAEALLDFQTSADLEAWLQNHGT